MHAFKKWMCDECGSLHRFYDDARSCCQPAVSAVYVCNKCEAQHSTEDDASACCAETEAVKTPNDAKDRAELEARGQLRLVE